MKNHISVTPDKLKDNVFKLIGTDWMLITAGNPEYFNTMTASWGGLGHLWNKNVSYIFIRPQRYTYEFVEKNEHYTLCFFDERYRKALNICGSRSGRNADKVHEAGLTTGITDLGSVFFSEARMVMECKKLYYQDITPANFIDPSIDKNYAAKDYHRMYIGEILSCLVTG